MKRTKKKENVSALYVAKKCCLSIRLNRYNKEYHLKIESYEMLVRYTNIFLKSNSGAMEKYALTVKK